MKKTTLLLGLAIVAILAIFSSCDKDKEATPLSVDLSKTATIKGYVYADLDRTSAGLESAPAGTKLILSVDHDDLNSDSDGVWKDTVTVDGNGMFIATVPADDNGVSVDIVILPFEYDQVQAYGSFETTIKMLFEATHSGVSIASNEIEVIQISFTSTEFDNLVKQVEISGEVLAELNDTITGNETVAAGTTFVLFTDGWNTTVTVGADGKYTAIVPAGEDISADIEFNADKVVYDVDASDYLPTPYAYEALNISVGSFSSSTENVDISAGSGTEIE